MVKNCNPCRRIQSSGPILSHYRSLCVFDFVFVFIFLYSSPSSAGQDCLVVFGGRSVRRLGRTYESFDLDDLQLFHIPSQRWHSKSQSPPSSPNTFTPHPRYAHISAVSGNQLYIFGGQDINDQFLDEILVCDLPARSWVAQHGYPTHVGRYRSISVSSSISVQSLGADDDADSGIDGGSIGRGGGPNRRVSKLTHLPYTKHHTLEDPPGVCLFTNIKGKVGSQSKLLHFILNEP